ncbi:MAG TPA: VCBS repeat-containing protein, partial [Flavisolibacter sp.]|nr:VCBS repeat-containing protein [Flavisolibacter sp.]
YNTGSVNYKDRFYQNDGKGNFSEVTDALPVNYTSKLCVRAMDYNKDGRLDIFLSGRVDPWHYPRPVSSFIYRNDSKNGKAKFTDVTSGVAPDLKNIGMVCDALFTDFDSDGQQDLLLAGEWMPLVFLKNTGGRFANVTAGTGIGGQYGWWNSIVAGDFRHTGRTDYIVGNVGLNTLYKASNDHPVYITAKDFDANGGYEAVPSLYLPAPDGSLKEYPANGRDELIDKMPFLKKRFNNYNSFASATLNDVLTNDMRKGALRMEANNLQSCFVRNDGGGKFTLIPLPVMAQVSALNGMVADDFDGDGNLDVAISGNDYGTEVSIGRYDALNGLVLKGDGKGAFTALSILQSGIYIPGNGKGLVKLRAASGNYLIAAAQNLDALKIFALKAPANTVKINPDDAYAVIRFRNGSSSKEEFYFGNSFLSQSSRFFTMNKNVSSVKVVNSKGAHRTISNNDMVLKK